MKLNICVYAIAKDEIKFVDRWYESMKEADWVVVLDTGSTDGTAERLRELGCEVQVKRIEPWRFDVARNESMKLIPKEADVCVCTDIDEVLHAGWRDCIERNWRDDSMQGRYRYTWNFNKDGSEGTVFVYSKVHRNNAGFRWVYPVHEILLYEGDTPHKFVNLPEMQLDHYADDDKSRASYLDLLKMAVEEDPTSDRNLHYYGRELMQRGMYEEALVYLQKHIDLPTSSWREERCASYRFMGRCNAALSRDEEALVCFYKGVAEAAHLREPYVDMAKFLYKHENWFGVLFYVHQAIKIEKRPACYICEAESWGAFPYDIASIAYFRIGNTQNAKLMNEAALLFSPNDERLQTNMKTIEEHLAMQKQVLSTISSE